MLKVFIFCYINTLKSFNELLKSRKKAVAIYSIGYRHSLMKKVLRAM